MSGDRLAEKRGELVRALNHGFRTGGLLGVDGSQDIIDTWDALVKIAKAARPIRDWLESVAIDTGIEGATDRISEYRRFAAALARLDSGAAEENT